MSSSKKDRNNIIFQQAVKSLNLRFPVAYISKKMDYGKGNISNFLNDKKPVSDDFLDNFFKTFDLKREQIELSIDWEEIESSLVKNKVISDGYQQVNMIFVPFVGINEIDRYSNNFDKKEYLDSLPKEAWTTNDKSSGKKICFEVSDDSMDDGSYKSYRIGDRLLCRKIELDFFKTNIFLEKNAYIIVKNKGGSLKRIIDHDLEKGIFTCKSFNSLYSNFSISIKEIAEFYIISSVKRDRLD